MSEKLVCTFFGGRSARAEADKDGLNMRLSWYNVTLKLISFVAFSYSCPTFLFLLPLVKLYQATTTVADISVSLFPSNLPSNTAEMFTSNFKISMTAAILLMSSAAQAQSAPTETYTVRAQCPFGPTVINATATQCVYDGTTYSLGLVTGKQRNVLRTRSLVVFNALVPATDSPRNASLSPRLPT